MDIVEKMRILESDHDPDGWPAVTMGQVSALCDEIEMLRAKLKGVQEREPDYWKIGGLGGDVITNKKSELDLAERFNWPVEPLYKHPQPAQSAIPEGYCLAPKEPTASMLDAGVAMALQVSVHGEGGWSKYLLGLYKQMLSASPKP